MFKILVGRVKDLVILWMPKTSLVCKFLHEQGPVYEPTFHVTDFLSLAPKSEVPSKGSHLLTTLLPYNSFFIALFSIICL